MWILMSADMQGIDPRVAMTRIEDVFVGSAVPATRSEVSEYFRIPRVDDHIPDRDAWERYAPSLRETVLLVKERTDEIDDKIRQASPRWRMDRMPVIDRTLLRMGVAELLFVETPRPRATLNGLIELAKKYGEATTPRFVNGILDQIRKDHDIPFS